MRRLRITASTLTLLAVLALAVLAPAAQAAPPHRIPLPNGWQPEGIAIGHGNSFYAGSLATGAVYRGSARTGEGSVLVEPHEGRVAVGLKVAHRKLYVAGGPTGQAYVYDARSGDDIATLQLTEEETFVNDVVVTDDAAWFTDSFNPVLYRVPLRHNGHPAPEAKVETVALSGIRFLEGFNINGIEATPNGEKLVVVQSNTGLLFTVDADTGRARRIDLGGARVRNGDGILFDGRTLYVVVNMLNQIAVVELERGLHAGEVVKRVTSPGFDVPTTVAQRGDFLYVVNARFGTTPTPRTRYWITVVRKP
jgi:sugar lactone lactonase YvrE